MPNKQFLNPPFLHESNKIENWKSCDTLENYNNIKDKSKLLYGPSDIVYKNNNRGFRCDDFGHWKNYPYRILFAGSSDTEGIGLPLKDVWAKIMHEMICKKIGEHIPYWNIAHGGCGLDHILRYLYVEGELLKPQVVISLVPYIERRERWDGDMWVPGRAWDSIDRASDKLLTDKNFIQYQTEKNFAMIDLLMQKWKSNFLFTTLDPTLDVNYMLLTRVKQGRCSSSILTYPDRARDNIHVGPVAHRTFAEDMFIQFWPRIKSMLEISS